MSLAAPATVRAAQPLMRWRRHYQGPVLTLSFTEHPPLRITPGHPVLTHLGWRRPSIIDPGLRVVVTDPGGEDADAAYLTDALTHGTHPLPTVPADFRGDGTGRVVDVVCPDPRVWPPQRPWTGDEGHPPAVNPLAVRAVLDALCTTAEFRVATWAQACEKVPGLAAAYPDGPVPRYGPINPASRRRLSPDTLAALPEPPLNRTGLGTELLSIPTPLRLVEVIAVDTEPSTTIAHDLTTADGAMLAGGVVVAG